MHETYRKINVMGVSSSNLELRDLGKAWLAISVAFAIAISGLGMSSKFLNSFFLSAFTVGIGFLFHELSHKLTAGRYGCHSEFRANNTMLLIAILLSFFGFVLAAPGAVFIATQHIGKVRNGKISAAGPLANLVLAVVFLGGYFIAGVYAPSFALFARYGFFINAWLGLFNLIPIPGFDGSKVLAWSKPHYIAMVAVGFVLFAMQGVL